MMDNGGGEEELEVSISNLIKCSIFRQLIITSSSIGGVPILRKSEIDLFSWQKTEI